MKNKIIAICFCALALIIALIFCDMQLKSEAASENSQPYVDIAIGGNWRIEHDYADEIIITDRSTVQIKMNGHLYETVWDNIAITWY